MCCKNDRSNNREVIEGGSSSVVCTQEGFRFIPWVPPIQVSSKTPPPDVLAVTLHGWYEWGNVRQYCKALWINTLYKCNPLAFLLQWQYQHKNDQYEFFLFMSYALEGKEL